VFDRADCNPGHRLDIVVGRAKQHRAQPEKLTWNLVVENLAAPVRHQLVGTGPTLGQNMGRLIDLALMHQIAACGADVAAAMLTGHHRQIDIRERNKGAQLARERAILNRRRRPPVMPRVVVISRA